MKLPCIAIAVCLAILTTLSSVFARPLQEASQSVPPKKIVRPSQYELVQVDITQAGHSVRMWELKRLNNTEPMLPLPSFFQSLSNPGFRQWVSQLPPGSGIMVEFSLGRGTGIGRPLKPYQATFWKELHEFTEFSQNKKVDIGMLGNLF